MKKRFFSYSRILDYATCPQKYYFRNVLRIDPKEKSKALAMGSCVSRALQAYRKEGSLNKAIDAFKDTWEEEGKVLRLDIDPNFPKDFRTVKRGIELIRDYVLKYPDDPKNTIEPEVPFEVPLFEDKDLFLLRGRIDGVFVNDSDVCIGEDKTTSQLGETFLPNLAGSLQIKIYLWAADYRGLFEIGGKKKTPRCLMNAMRVHPTEFRFKRDMTIQSRPQLELAKANIVNWIKRILVAEADGNFPLNDVNNSVCTMYGGCEYLPLRYKEGSVRESLLKNEYVVRTSKKEEHSG